MDWTRLLDLLLQGKDSLDVLIAAGDAKALEYPEIRDQWEIDRAALVAVRDNPETRATLIASLNEAWATIKAGHGPVGPSQAHHG